MKRDCNPQPLFVITQEARKIDTLFYNGLIRSMDEAGTCYEAIGITGDKITFLGSNEEAAALEAENRIDLNGTVLMPSFNEGHMHLSNYAFVNCNVPLFHCTSVEECIAEARNYLQEHPDAKWMYCRGFNEDNFTGEKRYPTKQELDAISDQIPILFVRVCGHVAVTNTPALTEIMKLEQAAALTNEIIEEDGRLYEGACPLFYLILEKPDQEYIKNLLRFGMKELNKCGITICQPDDFKSVPGADWRDIMGAYKSLEAEGEMTVRIYQQCLFERFCDYEEFLEAGHKTGQGGDFYKVGPLKLLLDGSLGAKTAALTAPYEGTEDEYGITIFTQEELDQFVITAQKNHTQVAVHCIGDKAMEMCIEAYKKANEVYPLEDMRHGIDHVQITTEHVIDEMAANGIVAYIQPVFVDYDMDIAEKCVGPDRVQHTYAWKKLIDKGVLCVGGSDAPVESFDILDNIYYAVTREKLKGGPEGGWLPQYKLPVDEAVRLFTSYAAKSCFAEDKVGMLKVGMLADLVVLEEDLYAVEPHHIKDVKVLRTVCGGKTVYEA